MYLLSSDDDLYSFLVNFSKIKKFSNSGCIICTLFIFFYYKIKKKVK